MNEKAGALPGAAGLFVFVRNHPGLRVDRPSLGGRVMTMQSLKARVRNGRLVLDEPTSLPEGEEIELVPLEDAMANGADFLDEEERERLHAALRRGDDDIQAGRMVPAQQVIATLRERSAKP